MIPQQEELRQQGSAWHIFLLRLERLAWLMLLAGVGLIYATKGYHGYYLAGLGLCYFPLLIQLALGRRPWRQTPVDLALVGLVGSVAAGLWVSYDPQISWPFVVRLLAGLGLLLHLWQHLDDPRRRRWWGSGLAAVAPLLAGLVLTQFDRLALTQKFQTLLGTGDGRSGLVSVTGDLGDPNILAGAIACTWPLLIALTATVVQELRAGDGTGQDKIIPSPRLQLPLLFLLLLANLVACLGLLMTLSRGAWLALVLAAILWVGVRALRGRQVAPVVGLGIGALAGLVGLVFSGMLSEAALLAQPLLTAGMIDRFGTYEKSVLLARDFWLTGIGPQTFFWRYASDILLSPPQISHAHNLFLQIWLDLGLLGLMSITAIIAAVYLLGGRRGNGPASMPDDMISQGALWGTTVFLLHGLVDAGHWQGRPLVLLWALLGLATGVAWRGLGSVQVGILNGRRQVGILPRTLPYILAGVTGLGVLLWLGLWTPSRLLGAWQANLGAVEQGKLELPQWEKAGDVDFEKVRRASNYASALAHFEQALSLYPANVTARQRIAEIDLSQGRSAQAAEILAPLAGYGEEDILSRALLAEAYAAAGQVEQAVSIVPREPVYLNHLLNTAWYRYSVTGDYQRALYTYQVVLAISPANRTALEGLQNAQQQIGKK